MPARRPERVACRRGAAQAAIDRGCLGAVVGGLLTLGRFAKAKAGWGEECADCRGLAELAEEDRHVRGLDAKISYGERQALAVGRRVWARKGKGHINKSGRKKGLRGEAKHSRRCRARDTIP